MTPCVALAALAAWPLPAVCVPGDRLAKTILLEDSRGYVTAVIPSTHHLKLSELREQTGRRLTLAREDGVREVFRIATPDLPRRSAWRMARRLVGRQSAVASRCLLRSGRPP